MNLIMIMFISEKIPLFPEPMVFLLVTTNPRKCVLKMCPQYHTTLARKEQMAILEKSMYNQPAQCSFSIFLIQFKFNLGGGTTQLFSRTQFFSNALTASVPSTHYLEWASSLENLSSEFPTKRVSNQSPQLQRLARKLKRPL